MALCKSLTKRLLAGFETSRPVISERSPMFSPYLQSSIVPPNAVKTNFFCEYFTSPEWPDKGFVRNFVHCKALHHSASTLLTDFISFPLGDKLREKLRGTNLLGNHASIDSLVPPIQTPGHDSGDKQYGMTVEDARKLLTLYQGEKLKAMLREIPKTSISYCEFLRICMESVGNAERGAEFAKKLDDHGHVVVLGNVVLLRPEQVAKTMETFISESIMGNQKEFKSEELELLENRKAEIDRKAQAQVKGELYCGLGFLVAQMAGFIRLTFWELSWDVMEPICFFVTSIHFALAYGFFVRTSTEPTFQGYFCRRFQAKQRRLMKAHKFDLKKYKELKKAFNVQEYPKEAFAPREPMSTAEHFAL